MDSRYGEQIIKVFLLKSDLIQIDKLLDEPIEDGMLKILLIKNIFIVMSNLVDFELSIRSMYKENPHLSNTYKQAKKQFEFAKYIRNKYVGHIKDELIKKSIEWRPELKYFIIKAKDSEMGYIYNLFILETIINTYVDNDGKHRIFNTETDLIYPPNMTRFLDYLYFIVQSGMKFLIELSSVLETKVIMMEITDADKHDWIKAGQTDFKYIRK